LPKSPSSPRALFLLASAAGLYNGGEKGEALIVAVKRHLARMSRIIQFLCTGGFALSLLLLWDRFTRIREIRESAAFFAVPFVAVIVVTLATSLRSTKDPSLRSFMHLFKVFISITCSLITALVVLDSPRGKSYNDFYLLLVPVGGILVTALYGCCADFKELKSGIKDARPEKPARTHLVITSAGMYVIAGLLGLFYVGFNGMLAFVYYMLQMNPKMGAPNLRPLEALQFISGFGAGSLGILCLVILNVLAAFFVRRARRWAAVATLTMLAAYLYYLWPLLYLFMKEEREHGTLYSSMAGVLYNPFFYFFIYCFIALVFIEKIYRKRRSALTPPR